MLNYSLKRGLNQRTLTGAVALMMTLSIHGIVASEASAQQDFVIDNTHTSVVFSISHYRIGYLYGRFNQCSGHIVFDPFNPATSEFRFKIDANSVDTNNADRDTALRSNQFLDVATYPEIEFVSTSVTESEGTYNAKGKLKIKDVTKEVTIAFKLLGTGDGPMGKSRIGMISKFIVKRSDYGMDEMLKNIGDDVAITFSFQAVRK